MRARRWCRSACRSSRGPAGGPQRIPGASVSMLLLVLVCAGLVGLARSGERAAAPRGVGQRIIETVAAANTSPEEKVRALGTVRGVLSHAEAKSVATTLRQLRGEVLLAAAEAMWRCGAADQATTAMLEIASSRDTAPDQWAAALRFSAAYGAIRVPPSWEAPPIAVPEVRPAIAAAQAQIAERLRKPKDEQELLALLGERKLLWRQEWCYRGYEDILGELSRLLRHRNGKVRALAAQALSTTAFPQMIPGSAVLALTSVLADADEQAARAVDDLLRTILGVEPDSDELADVRRFWHQWAQAAGPEFSLTKQVLSRIPQAGEALGDEKCLLAIQLQYASREATEAEREEACRALIKAFETDRSPAPERTGAWLKPLGEIAARTQNEKLRRDVLRFFLRLLREEEPGVRLAGIAMLGRMPAAVARGSAAREALDRILVDKHADPKERAVAAWSLRHAVRSEKGLALAMMAVAVEFLNLPGLDKPDLDERSLAGIPREFREQALRSVPTIRVQCITRIRGVLSEASTKELGEDPTEWQQSLQDWLAGLPDNP